MEMAALHLPSFSIQPSPTFAKHCVSPHATQLRAGFVIFQCPSRRNPPKSGSRMIGFRLLKAVSDSVSSAEGAAADSQDEEVVTSDSADDFPADSEDEKVVVTSDSSNDFPADSEDEKVVATIDSANDSPDSKTLVVVAKLQAAISPLSPFISSMKTYAGCNSKAIWLSTATAIFLFIAVRVYVGMTQKSKHNRPGTVADLVRRGQLRSDRRAQGISSLKYEDPFNNPYVKLGKSNSTVEMCGKVYKLSPVTLTKEEQAIHQRRRSRAYQWKRPTMFLKEGDSIPPDVDPESVRWIPANHPFATTSSDIDESLAQTNVYQKHGVPFRIQAEHEALQRKLEGLQQDQKLNKFFIDSDNAKAYERSLKLHPKSNEAMDQNPSANQDGNSSPSSSNSLSSSFNSTAPSDELQKP
ncbi:unnamed protein product [Linum trigynum]|uniref:Protein MULTIPLE CHLOROPLAST DIVISION SITE 1 n=1 Tax=Linum trigynum TaxID=586398 RepID=A0AAV2EDE7_9ROSI